MGKDVKGTAGNLF